MGVASSSFKIPCENCNKPVVIEGPRRSYELCDNRICDICARILSERPKPETEKPIDEKTATQMPIWHHEFSPASSSSDAVCNSSIYDSVKESTSSSRPEKETASLDPTEDNLALKINTHKKLLEEFKKFRYNLERDSFTASQYLLQLERTPVEVINFMELKSTVESLLENRNKFLEKALVLKITVRKAFTEINTLIINYEAVFGGTKLRATDFEQVQLLKRLTFEYQNTWDQVTKLWETTKDDIRYLNYIVENKKVPRTTFIAGRPWVGIDAYGVISFHWGFIEQSTDSEKWDLRLSPLNSEAQDRPFGIASCAPPGLPSIGHWNINIFRG